MANNKDLMLAESGRLAAEKVRRVKMRGVVDSGVTRWVLPKSVVKEWGVQTVGKIKVRDAGGRKAVRELVDGVHVELLGRSGVEPKRDSALIGMIVWEDLDFLIDPVAQRLSPRDPKRIVTAIE